MPMQPIFSLFLLCISVTTLLAHETPQDFRLRHARKVMIDVVQAEKSANLFTNNPQFAAYREALGVLEKSHCAGAYRARCDRFKQELVTQGGPLLTETNLAGKVQALSVLAVHGDLIVDESNSLESAQAIKSAGDPLKAAISAADPAQYAAIAAAYRERRASIGPDGWRVVREELHDLCADMLGAGNAADTEGAVAAAEVRMAGKKK